MVNFTFKNKGTFYEKIIFSPKEIQAKQDTNNRTSIMPTKTNVKLSNRSFILNNNSLLLMADLVGLFIINFKLFK